MGENKGQTTGRFGARYGKNIRQNTAAAEQQYRKRNTCPACRATALKREAAGIWLCRKCDTKIAGDAYSPPQSIDRSVTRKDIDTLVDESPATESVDEAVDDTTTEVDA